MSLANTAQSYGGVTKTFHWLTALLILAAFPVGWFANRLAHAIEDPAIATTPEDLQQAAQLFSLHKTIGVTVFIVALARILWALSQPKPGLLNAENKPEAFAAETVHWLLYGSLVLVPLTGWIHHAATEGFAPILWPFGQNLPFVPKSPEAAEVTGGLHKVLMLVLLGALVLHIAGALKHHVIDKDSTLRRMLPGRIELPEPPQQWHSTAPAFAAIVIWGAALAIGWFDGAYSAHPTADHASTELEAVQSDWQVQEGTLGITITQLGSPVNGGFSEWTAAITFDDPVEPGPAGSVDVTVAIGSLSIGTVTDQALGTDFFDSSQFPTAQFTADLFKTDLAYEARGTLNIRDKSMDVVLPFELDLLDGTAKMQGELELNRLDFDIGKSQSTEDSLAFGVKVTVALTATQAE
ncbi:cytochrome b/b6 domain-containing protein [Ruegeria sp. Ofav3-42]|uniref:cytochrome b/b6 domain-containing protein n=1 Tax=Ruegeria sp. Ofav3-42 TaxID=2917759 RepID=UPI001EF4CF14|nr:cytochrome b/b6 domain-containing protein [Ruegeria sp. Ofav3-42]MCG7521288.1 cytochrome b/b6 domain-containing protein [Ruegeria sp. Ofav3-42]